MAEIIEKVERWKELHSSIVNALLNQESFDSVEEAFKNDKILTDEMSEFIKSLPIKNIH